MTAADLSNYAMSLNITYVSVADDVLQIPGQFRAVVNLVQLDGRELGAQCVEGSFGNVAVGTVGGRKYHHFVLPDQFLDSARKYQMRSQHESDT